MQSKRIVISFLVFGLLQVSMLSARAQEQGRNTHCLCITDKYNGDPLPAAVIHRGNEYYTADTLGIVCLPPGTEAKFSISCLGYKDYNGILRKPANADTLHIRMEPSSQLLGAVLVTANARHTPVTSIAATLQRADLLKHSGENLAKMLESIPGITGIQSGATVSKPSIQGMAGSRVTIVQNGVRMEGQDWGRDHAPELDPSMAGQIEVIKGADAVRYGPGALGGIILVEPAPLPRDPQLKSRVGADYGLNGNMARLSLGMENAVKKVPGLAWRFGASASLSGDYRTARYVLNNTGTRLASANLQLGYHSGNWGGELFYSLYLARMGIFFGSHISSQYELMRRFRVGRPEITAPPSFRIVNPKQNVRHHLWKLSLKHRLGNTSTLSFTYSFQMDLREEFSRRIGEFNKLPALGMSLQTHDLDFCWISSPEEPLQGEVGLAYAFRNNTTDDRAMSSPLIPNYVNTTIGSYAIAHRKVSENFRLSGGLRYDLSFSNSIGFDRMRRRYGGKRDFKGLSANVAAHYTPCRPLALTLSLGQAWRAPDVSELYSNGLHHGEGVYEIGNPDLKSEKGFKGALEAKLTFGRVRFEGTAFLQHVENYIYDCPGTEKDGSPEILPLISGTYPVFRFRQANARFWGGDISLRIEITRHLHYAASASWVRAKNIEADGYFPFIPSDRYGQELGWSARYQSGAVAEIYATPGWKLVTKQTRFDPRLDFVPASPAAYQLFTFDAGMSWRLGGNMNLRTMLGIENLANILYKEYTNRFRYYAHDKGFDLRLRLLLTF